MYDFLHHAHMGWGYFVLFLLTLTEVRFIHGILAKRKWEAWDKRLMLFAMIAVDVQTLAGMILLLGFKLTGLPGRMEHAGTMLIAIFIVHGVKILIGKTEDDTAKFRRGVIGIVIASLLMAAGIYRIVHAG